MIALIILTGLVALGFLLKFKVDYNIKVLRRRIMNNRVGMRVKYFNFVGESDFGTVKSYINGFVYIEELLPYGDDDVYEKNIRVPLSDIYPPKPF